MFASRALLTMCTSRFLYTRPHLHGHITAPQISIIYGYNRTKPYCTSIWQMTRMERECYLNMKDLLNSASYHKGKQRLWGRTVPYRYILNSQERINLISINHHGLLRQSPSTGLYSIDSQAQTFVPICPNIP